MKLATIRTDLDLKPWQIRHICGGSTILSETVKGRDSPPLSYLFIESVLTTNILREAGQSRFEALLQAGLAKLNSTLTPGNASDLDDLLNSAAPDGGGSQQVTKLVQQAAQAQGDITDDQGWWDELFHAFGVEDQTVKIGIQNQVRQNIGSEVAPTEAPASASEAASTPEAAPRTSELLAQLRALQGNITASQGDRAVQLAELNKQHQENQAKIEDTKNRIDQVKATQNQASTDYYNTPGNYRSGITQEESICSNMAIQLLREHEVCKNLNVITTHMFRKMISGSRNRYIKIPALNEAGLRDRLMGVFNNARNFAANPEYANRLMGVFNNARNFAANPEYAKNKLGGVRSSANNQRTAKLAVQILTDHLRQNPTTSSNPSGKIDTDQASIDQDTVAKTTRSPPESTYDTQMSRVPLRQRDPQLLMANRKREENRRTQLSQHVTNKSIKLPDDDKPPKLSNQANRPNIHTDDKAIESNKHYIAMRDAALKAGRESAEDLVMNYTREELIAIMKTAAANSIRMYYGENLHGAILLYDYFKNKHLNLETD